jgi:subtilisin
LKTFALVVLLMIISSQSLVFGESIGKEISMKRYFVSFHTEADPILIKSVGGDIKHIYKYIPVISANLSESAVKILSKNTKIKYVEEDGRVKITSTLDLGILQTTPWGVSHVKAPDVHKEGIKGTGIKIGVIDTGIDYTHEDLNVVGGATFVDGTIDYMDDNGHGTHVAGTISALDNLLGVIGVAPNTSLYAIKVLDKNGSGSYGDVVAGIEWAVSNNIDILNMSFGGSLSSQTLESAVDIAYDQGLLLVAAAGNNGYDESGTITYPAKYDSVIAVGAVDQENNRANFSSVGWELELMAPGVSIESTVPGGYNNKNGTSMASPHVAGVAALVWEMKPEINNIQLRSILNETATSLGDSFSYGNGLVNAINAVNY